MQISILLPCLLVIIHGILECESCNQNDIDKPENIKDPAVLEKICPYRPDLPACKNIEIKSTVDPAVLEELCSKWPELPVCKNGKTKTTVDPTVLEKLCSERPFSSVCKNGKTKTKHKRLFQPLFGDFFFKG